MSRISQPLSREFRLYGIFGFPLAHTLSPRMQEAAFRLMGWKAFYLPFELKRSEFRQLMRRRARLVLDGFNVTVPYKEEAAGLLDQLSPSAKAMGAVNTAVRVGKRWMGFNTDWLGFVHSIEKDAHFKIRGKQILILGAGGSARAVAYGLAKKGARGIRMANRTSHRARGFVREYRHLFPRVKWDWQGGFRIPRSEEWTRQFDLVVNATSVGLKASDPALVFPEDFPKRTFFVDLIYRPIETRFLRLARISGHRTLNGLGMLLYQGAEALRLWTGKKAPVEGLRQALKQTLGK